MTAALTGGAGGRRRRLRDNVLLLVAASMLGVDGAAAAEARVGRQAGGATGGGRMPLTMMRTEVPAQAYDLVLGRPTRTTITVSVLAYAAREGYLVHGLQPGKDDRETPRQSFPAGEPVAIELDGLVADTRHYYRLRSRPVGATEWEDSAEGTFMTARPPGAAFTFTVQADPHLDFGTDPAVYLKSLGNALAARTDFHVDLGDTFMTDKYPKFTDAAPQYLAQRYYFSRLSAGAPVFLVLGNHDGEQPGRGAAGPESMAVWSNGMRKKYFPNPRPDAFYTGNATPDRHAGVLENYYAWEWGDALFVALDPFWYSTRARGRDGNNWSRTLGEAQYRWLERTLDQSTAKYCFVFIHHLAGGETPEGRGGAEASRFFEWGGHDLDGRNTFAQHRPGWTAPIHDLLVRRGGGCVVFHGHDHLYAQQERDGIVYQLVPQPGHQRFDNTRSAAEYGYKSGVIQGASGIVRVSVAPGQTRVDYVRAYPDSAESASRRTGSVSHSYVVSPRALPARGN